MSIDKYSNAYKKMLSHLKINFWAYFLLPFTNIIVFKDFFLGKTISAVPTQGGAIWPG